MGNHVFDSESWTTDTFVAFSTTDATEAGDQSNVGTEITAIWVLSVSRVDADLLDAEPSSTCKRSLPATE